MQCLILAGGLGTRMRSVASDKPKAMIEIAGTPFIGHQLALLASQGIDRVVLSVGYLAASLRDYVGDGSRWGLDVHFIEDGPLLLGTGGAVRQAVEKDLMDDGFFVIYGDSYLPTDFRAVWAASKRGRVPTMTLFHNDGRWDRSNVRFSPGKPLFYDKKSKDPMADGMAYIDYGLSVLPQKLVRDLIPLGQAYDLADLYYELSCKGKMAGFEVSERFYECGSVGGLADFERYLNECKGSSL